VVHRKEIDDDARGAAARSPVRFARLRNFRTPVLSRLSIQSKLLIMLLVTSILSAAVVGFIGYQSGRSSLRAAVFDALTEIRGSQSRQLEAQFSDLTSSLIVYTRGATTSEALAAFTPAFDQLVDAAISPQQQQSVDDYYSGQFAEAKLEQTGQQLDSRALTPTSNQQRYLQALYTAPFKDWDAAIRFDDARDSSPWSALRGPDHLGTARTVRATVPAR
jgi:hypothetical protein